LECQRQPETPHAPALLLATCYLLLAALHMVRFSAPHLPERGVEQEAAAGKAEEVQGSGCLARLMLTHVDHCKQKLCCARPPLRERRMSEEAAAKLSDGPLLELAFEVGVWANPPGWRPQRSSPAPPRRLRLRRGARAFGKDERICNPRGRRSMDCNGGSSAERGAAQEQARARAPRAALRRFYQEREARKVESLADLCGLGTQDCTSVRSETPGERKAENAHGVGWQETARCALPGFGPAVVLRSREGLQLLKIVGGSQLPGTRSGV
jgi:hypothetical protein